MVQRTRQFPYGEPDSRHQIDRQQLAMPLVLQGGVSRQRQPIILNEHTHTGYELHVIISGRSTQITATGDRLAGRGGSVLLMQPGVLHRGEDDIIPKSHLVWLVIDPTHSQASRNTPFTKRDCQTLDQNLAALGNRCVKASGHTLAMAERLDDLLEQGDHPPASLRACLSELILTCQADLGAATARTTILPPPVAQALRILADHQAAPLAIPDLAARVGLSPSRFHQLFKDHIGMTPADYHLRNRVGQARNLLRQEPVMSIAAIADATGFSSARHLATVFKSFTGTSPSLWRQAVSGQD